MQNTTLALQNIEMHLEAYDAVANTNPDIHDPTNVREMFKEHLENKVAARETLVEDEFVLFFAKNMKGVTSEYQDSEPTIFDEVDENELDLDTPDPKVDILFPGEDEDTDTP